MPRRDLLAAMFRDIDAMDADAFARWLSDDVVFQYGNWPPAQGRAATREVVARFFGTIAGLTHRLLGCWDCGEVTSCRFEVSYTRHDGGQVVVPAATILTYRGDLVCDYRIFVDPSPLFA